MGNKVFNTENIITGLFKNLLKKNQTYGKEGFKVFDKHFFIVELDVSGFDYQLIKEALTNLASNPEWHHYESGTFILTSNITVYESNIDDKSVKFLIEKEKLIKLRDSLIKS